MRPILTWTCAFLLLPWFAWADIAGDQDRRYQNTLRNWLAREDDLAALREFAALSAGDNLAAQITLGLIERRPETYMHAIRELSGKQRSAIFKSPDGRFGTRWMNIAASSHPLAALLVDRSDKDYVARAIALADAGLIWEAARAAQLPVNLGDTIGTMRALNHESILPHIKWDLFQKCLLLMSKILPFSAILNAISLIFVCRSEVNEFPKHF